MRFAIALPLVLSTVLSAAGPARASEIPGIPRAQPLILRLEGRFASDRDAALANGRDVLSIRIADRDRWLTVDRATTVSGDHPLNGRDVLNLLAPLQPNLIVVGAQSLRDRLTSAPDGEPVRLEGLVDRGSRTLLLRDVQVKTARRLSIRPGTLA
jgi:hypothetical protein